MSSELDELQAVLRDMAQEMHERFGFSGGVACSVLSEAIDRLRNRRKPGIITAQHEDTGRMWTGQRDQIPPRYAELGKTGDAS